MRRKELRDKNRYQGVELRDKYGYQVDYHVFHLDAKISVTAADLSYMLDCVDFYEDERKLRDLKSLEDLDS